MTDYEAFYQLHQQEKPFMLANAWNAKSAQLAEKAGFKAIGTSSGAIAESLGYPDGEKIPFDELLYIVKRIKASVNIPVSVDMESGYTDDLGLLNIYIQQLLDIGIAGINIEDAQGEDVYLNKLTGIKNYLLRTKKQLFINARTDGFLQKLDSPLELTIARAKRYEAAGADGLFVTGVQDEKVIKAITSATDLPVNVAAIPKLSSPGVLEDCGVKRVSMAVFLYKATYKHLEGIASAIIIKNSLEPLHR